MCRNVLLAPNYEELRTTSEGTEVLQKFILLTQKARRVIESLVQGKSMKDIDVVGTTREGQSGSQRGSFGSNPN